MNRIAELFFHNKEEFWRSGTPEEQWRLILTAADPSVRQLRSVFKFLPAEPRCNFCNAPFRGAGAQLMKLIGRTPSAMNPNFCGFCLDIAPIGGAEVELTMLFADVRGSTGLAERMGAAEFSNLINRFFSTSTRVLTQTNTLIDRLIGDEVIALFIPGFVGEAHAATALEAAESILRATGHAKSEGSWVPVGAGIHTGSAFVGKVGEEGVTDITVLGDAANVTARLAGLAEQGEILISDSAYREAGSPTDRIEARTLELKGRNEQIQGWSRRILPG
jgi:adenylate cyclase